MDVINESPRSTETAAQYLEAAKLCQDQLWQRRQIEWRTGFALWAAMGIVAGFAFTHVKRPIPDPLSLLILIIATITYIAVVIIYFFHQKAIFISNLMDLDMFVYYKKCAECQMSNESKPTPPEWLTKQDKSSMKKYIEKNKKGNTFYPSLWITVLIAFLSWSLIFLMYFENRHPSITQQEALVNILERKGLISKQEIIEEIKQLRKDID